MEAIESKAAEQWLGSRALMPTGRGIDVTGLGSPLKLMVPADAGRRMHLARVLAQRIVGHEGGLFWVREFGIWPSSEEPLIFLALRATIGEHRPLREAPAHLFEDADLPTLRAMLATLLYFSWGAILVTGNRRLVVQVSHDEVVEIYGSSDDLRALQESLGYEGFQANTPLGP